MHTKKQIYDNSCGAASLLCLGFDQLTKQTVKNGLGCAVGADENAVETAIYFATSGNDKTTKLASFAPKSAGYSLPSNICRASLKIGFKTVNVYMDDTSPVVQGLLGIYSSEESDTNGIPGCQVIKGAYYRWDAKNAGRCLVCISWNKGGFHWVYAFNGFVMDPGPGTISDVATFTKWLGGVGVVAGIFIVPKA